MSHLALKEVFIKNNSHNGHNNARDTHKTGQEEQPYIFRIETFNKGNEKSGKGGEEYCEVVHAFNIRVFCLYYKAKTFWLKGVLNIIQKLLIKNRTKL